MSDSSDIQSCLSLVFIGNYYVYHVVHLLPFFNLYHFLYLVVYFLPILCNGSQYPENFRTENTELRSKI